MQKIPAPGAVSGNRTRNLRLGKPLLYQLSYHRLVPGTGFEPALFTELDPKSSASANSATRAKLKFLDLRFRSVNAITLYDVAARIYHRHVVQFKFQRRVDAVVYRCVCF